MERTCEMCGHYRPYYSIYRARLLKLEKGHCLKKRNHTASPCSKYIQKEPEKEAEDLRALIASSVKRMSKFLEEIFLIIENKGV